MKEGSSAALQLHHIPIETGFNFGSLASSISFTEQTRHLKEDSGAPSCKIINGLAPMKRLSECYLGVSFPPDRRDVTVPLQGACPPLRLWQGFVP